MIIISSSTWNKWSCVQKLIWRFKTDFSSIYAYGSWWYAVALCKTELTHCGLVTPYGDIDLGQWLGAIRHQAIIWANVDLSSKMFYGIHLRAISQEVPTKSIHSKCFQITLFFIITTTTPRGQWVHYTGREMRVTSVSPTVVLCVTGSFGLKANCKWDPRHPTGPENYGILPKFASNSFPT